VAASQFPFIPVRWLLRDKYESLKFAPAIKVPTLLIAAEHDEFIPRARTENLLRHFSYGAATLRIVPGVGHNTISASPQYVSLLAGR
jgi:pimeloyl-ACP methyl ester carboxylesterase